MKTKQFLLLLPLLLFTQISFGQNHIIKGRGLYLPGKPILYFNAGIGYEHLLDENLSLQLVYNYSGNDMRDTDGNANFKNEVVVDCRYYNTEIKPVSQAIFAFAFFSYSNEKNKQSGEIDFTTTPMISKKITTEKSLGAGIGKNFKVSKRFHLEVFAGPKFILREVKITSSDILSSFVSSLKSTTNKFDIRGGINLAYQF
ncbi:MAG: hypothetical protein AB8F94_04865 [Saprospiraceae bacterium]